MTTAGDVLRHKGYEVATISPWATVLEAAREMNLRRIGALVVIDDGEGGEAEGRERAECGVAASWMVGIVSERDVLTRQVAAERDPRTTLVREVMTSPVIFCERRTPLADLKELMRHRRIRHVPVIEGGTLCGLVSIGDVNAIEAEGMMQTITVLEEYITRG